MPDTPEGRISVTEALGILAPAYNNNFHAAAVRLTTATHANECRLWCNGNLLAPDYIAKALIVVACLEKDGRWRGDVVSSRREAWDPDYGPYHFGLDPAEVKKLPPNARGRHQGKRAIDPDEVLLDEMDGLLSSGAAKDPTGAARHVAPKAGGAGTFESVVHRLVRKHRERTDGQCPDNPDSPDISI
jgi:hypothetical protein